MTKRRKHKNNPYTIKTHQNTYTISFKDSNKNIITLPISEKLYQTFNQFELNDLKEMNEYDRHIEHKKQTDEFIYMRSYHKPLNIEQQVEKKILYEKLYHSIKTLPSIQKRRLIKYYFENKTLNQIAESENCSFRAVKYSIDIALKKLNKLLKNEI